MVNNHQSFFFPLLFGRASKFPSRTVSESTECSAVEPDVNEKKNHLNVFSVNVTFQSFNLEVSKSVFLLVSLFTKTPPCVLRMTSTKVNNFSIRFKRGLEY